MIKEARAARWKIIGNPVFIPGYLHGSRHPSVAFRMTLAPLSAGKVLVLDRLLAETFEAFHDASRRDPPSFALQALPTGWQPTAFWFVQSFHRLQILAGMPVFEVPRLLWRPNTLLRCFASCSGPDFSSTTALFKTLFSLMDAVLDGQSSSAPIVELKVAHERLRENQNPDLGVSLFAEAAWDRGIPVRHLARGVVQFGIGKGSRWLEGTFTGSTPNVGTKLARDKHAAAQMLRIAGIPVPDHRTALSADDAVEIAVGLKFPVVVKPANLDGGRGVAAGLINEDEVREAFEECIKLSPYILVEKHVEGRDYRIVVFQDRAIFAVERVPGGVVGNGSDSVEKLLADYNGRPFRSGTRALLGQMIIDDEARLLLGRQRLNLASIPQKDQVVRLRRAANIASGGTPLAVYDKAHPDNLDLAVRAARALRLDLAGIDLLIPDIEQSWRETGAAICEVNARPNLGQLTSAHLYGEILDNLVDSSGRIPVVIILGAEDPATLSGELERHFTKAGLVVGCHDAHEVRLAGIRVDSGMTTTFQAGQMMAVDPRVEMIILNVIDAGPLLTGLPFDRFDLLVLAGSHLEKKGVGPRLDVRQLVEHLLPACEKGVIPLEDCRSDFAGFSPDMRAGWHPPVSAKNLPDRVAELLLPDRLVMDRGSS